MNFFQYVSDVVDFCISERERNDVFDVSNRNSL